MKCYYELLEISRDADISEIKTSYRKLALKLHPDKNLENQEYAKDQFQLIQQAYEVLSDPQERAWYDKHREQILVGKNKEYSDNSLDVYQYFTTSCFKGFSDNEEGFYSVYRKVFEEINKEDIDYMENKEEFCEIPSFGTSTSDYDEVVGPFYAHWSSYSTKKSYVWLDPYNINETRDRKIVKLMEKENKKMRQKARKERNEEVRALVAFVRKRDKRVQEYSKKLEARIIENRKKQEELSRQRRLQHKKNLNESKSEAEWTKFDNVKNELEEIEKHVAEHFGEQICSSEDEEAEQNSLYCAACNKIFKTPKAFENHESSKKHKENVVKLKQVMLEEEDEATANTDEFCDEELSESISSTESDVDTQIKSNKKRIKKSKNVLQAELSDSENISFLENSEIDNEDKDFFNNPPKKNKQKSKKCNLKSDQPATNCDEHVESIIVKEMQKPADKLKKGKNNKGSKREKGEQVDLDIHHCCVTCKANFPSKNKLFDHLKKSGHSVYVQNDEKNRKSGKYAVMK